MRAMDVWVGMVGSSIVSRGEAQPWQSLRDPQGRLQCLQDPRALHQGPRPTRPSRAPSRPSRAPRPTTLEVMDLRGVEQSSGPLRRRPCHTHQPIMGAFTRVPGPAAGLGVCVSICFAVAPRSPGRVRGMALDAQDRRLGSIGVWEITCAALHLRTVRGFGTHDG